MLSMIFFELIPEALESISFALTNVCFFAGILLFAAIVSLVPEQKFESFVSKPRAGKARGKEAKEYQKVGWGRRKTRVRKRSIDMDRDRERVCVRATPWL